MLLANLATLATALFTGAAICISLAEHPARLLGPTAAAMAQWRRSYKRATLMQAPLAVAGALPLPKPENAGRQDLGHLVKALGRGHEVGVEGARQRTQ